MFNKLLVLLVLYGVMAPIMSQNLDELLDQVDLKLRKDKKYLNIHYISFPNNRINSSLQNIQRTNDREAVSFKQKDNVSYNIIFLKDAIGIDSLQLLYVDEITDRTGGGEKLFGETTGPVVDTMKILTFKDLWTLYRSQSPAYATLYNEVRKYLRENVEQSPSSLLRINPDSEIKTSLGISSRDNTDFLNFMRTNSMHYYPKAKAIEKKGLRKSTTVVDSTADFRIEAGFTSISLSHPSMDFSLGGASLELGVDEKLLNVLPYQSMSVTGGFRTLFSIVTDKKDDLNKALIFDAKILARVAVDMTTLPTSLPFMGASKPKLHLPTGGGIDLSVSKVFGLPFINIYAMAGAADVTNSPLKQLINGKNYAYYNNTSGAGSMSFYWNTSESMTSRFRLDLGVGFYDVYRAEFAKVSDRKPTVKSLMQNNMTPLVSVYFNFTPDGKDVIYENLTLFDSILKLHGWLKILELDGGHNFRLALTYVSMPLGRQRHEWETTGGSLVEVRYRYGF